MAFLQRLPWFSLILLLLTYTTFGWVLSRSRTQPILWLAVAIAIVIFIAILTIPLSKMADYSVSLFRSNLRSFGIAVLGAFLFFLIMARFRLFLDTLVIIAVTMLVKIDFQAAGFSQILAFWLTVAFSFAGLALGVLAEKLMFNYGLIFKIRAGITTRPKITEYLRCSNSFSSSRINADFFTGFTLAFKFYNTIHEGK